MSQLTAAEAGRELGFTRNMIRHWVRAGWLTACEPPASLPAGTSSRSHFYERSDLLHARALADEAIKKNQLAKLEKAWDARAELQGAKRGIRNYVKRLTPLAARGSVSLNLGSYDKSEAVYQPKPKVLRLDVVERCDERGFNLNRELRALARMTRG